MEKRLVIFLLCSVLILTGHMLFVRMFAPPRPAAQQAPDKRDSKTPPGKETPPRPDAKAPGEEPAKEATDATSAQPTTPEASKLGAVESTANTPPAVQTPPVPAVPQQWLTLGSYAPDSPHQLLVTLTNRGAAIERVELVERRANGRLRYRDLAGNYGYLGLQCRDTADGCAVTVVGPGTPAALAKPNEVPVTAGVLAGDVIETIDAATVGNRAEFESWLQGTKPQQVVQLGVRRVSADKTQHLVFSVTLDDRPLELMHLESPTPSYLLGLNRLGTALLPRGGEELPELPSLRLGHWEIVGATTDEVAFRYRRSGWRGEGGGRRGIHQTVPHRRGLVTG